MSNSAYQLIISNFCVGTWLQTLVFYFILFLVSHIIMVQLNLSIVKLRISFVQRWMEANLREQED